MGSIIENKNSDKNISWFEKNVKFHHTKTSSVDNPNLKSPAKKDGTPPLNSVRFVNHRTVDVETFDSKQEKIIRIDVHKTLLYRANNSNAPPHKKRLQRQTPLKVQRSPQRAPLTLRNVLLDRTLNVENLAIGEFQEIHLEPTDPLFLPALKTFSWHAESNNTNYSDIDSSEDEDDATSCTCLGLKHHHQQQEEFDQKKRQAAYQVLKAAPNLELIKDFHFDTDYQVVLAAEKVQCVQNLTLWDTVNVDHLLEFLGARPQVKVLQLLTHWTDDKDLELHPEEHERLALAIKLLFILSCDTVGVLDLSQICSSVDIQIPHKLPKLHQLSIGPSRGHHSQPGRVLPRLIRLDKIFFNLCVLDCSRLQCDVDDNWVKYFPREESHHGSFEAVKVLVISDNCTQFWMNQLKDLCPNFTKLVLQTTYSGGGDHCNFMLRKIFQNWHHLDYLELRLDDFPATDDLKCSLDSAISGFTEETCRKLRRAIGNGGGGDKAGDEYMGCIEKSLEPIRCSIAKMKKLKGVDIIFEHDCLGKLTGRLPAIFDDEAGDLPPLLTAISCRYGFSLLAGLKVALIFDHDCPWGKEIKRDLGSMACDFISLRHKRDNNCNLENHHHQHESQEEGQIEGGNGIKLYCYP